MRNPFAGMLSLFSFSRAAESVVGIDFGSSALKVVQLKKKDGQAVLETYGAVALGPYAGVEASRAARLSSVKLSEALADVMREAKVTARACGAALPMSASLVAAFAVPSRPGQDLTSFVPIEARKYIPTPLSEVEFSWRALPKRVTPASPADSAAFVAPPEKTEVLATAIHRDALERTKSICAEAGLAASFFEIEAFATARAGAFPPEQAFGVIDIGASLAKVSIVDGGNLSDAHTVNRGGQDITLALSSSLNISVAEAEMRKRAGAQSGDWQVASAVTTRIFGEAREVFRRFEARMGEALQGVVLSGGGALLAGLPAEAEQALHLRASLIDPASLLSAPAFLSPLLARVGPEFAVAIGVALRALEEVK